jgi:hypothetical protein
MTYDNTNTGILFRNDRRENEKQPEFTGTINVDGVEFWLSAWVKTSKEGRPQVFQFGREAEGREACGRFRWVATIVAG